MFENLECVENFHGNFEGKFPCCCPDLKGLGIPHWGKGSRCRAPSLTHAASSVPASVFEKKPRVKVLVDECYEQDTTCSISVRISLIDAPPPPMDRFLSELWIRKLAPPRITKSYCMEHTGGQGDSGGVGAYLGGRTTHLHTQGHCARRPHWSLPLRFLPWPGCLSLAGRASCVQGFLDHGGRPRPW